MKVIVMDVDGTLLNSQKEISFQTKVALLQAQVNGARLVLASGRPVSGMLAVARELHMHLYHGLLVAYNGSKAMDCQTLETLFNAPLSVTEGKAVLEHLKQFQVYPMIDRDQYLYVNDAYAPIVDIQGYQINLARYEARGGQYLLCEQKDLAAFLDFEVNKILTAGEPAYLLENWPKMMAPFAGRLSGMFTADFYFEFTAQGIDKGKALESVLTPLGYQREEVLAFGDGLNDISMLQYAGTGIAMGNAAAELKEIAQYVTASCDEDGIVEGLRRYL